MPIEQSIAGIHSLDKTLPTDDDPAQEGDNHIRNIKDAVKKTFANFTGVLGLSQTEVHESFDHRVPSGGIIMWSGSTASIPSGWRLCNGNNGTPDLRSRFVVGAGGSYDVGSTGGASSVTLSENEIPRHNHGRGSLSVGNGGSHNHGGTAGPGGRHIHKLFNPYGGSSRRFEITNEGGAGASYFNEFGNIQNIGGTYVTDALYTSGADNIANGEDHVHSITTDGVHGHPLSGSTADAGGNGSHENRPPYFALAYIMKL